MMRGLVDRARVWCDGLLTIPARQLSRGRIHVLMYHRVLPEPELDHYPLANLVVSEAQFDLQMSWLRRHARVMTVEQALESDTSSVPTVCVTFDDGYECNARVARPILEKHGLRGTFYVTTSFIQGRALWFDSAAAVWAADPERVQRVARQVGLGGDAGVSSLDSWLGMLKRLIHRERDSVLQLAEAPGEVQHCGAMTLDQLAEMASAGHEIGSHTVWHPILPREGEADLRAELVDSREQIRSWTGAEPAGLCYPNGDHSSEVREAVERAGYRYACAIGRGSHRLEADDRYSVKRRFVTRWNSAGDGVHSDSSFAGEVLGVHDAIRRAARAVRR